MLDKITLATALVIAGVAEYFSILGLTSIFTGAFYSIIVMGVVMALGKIVATSWVYRNWHTAPAVIKYYLIAAIIVLMSITSLGTFGFLSKAHLDSALPLNDIASKLAVYDDKIVILKENIDVNRKSLKQLDEAVDQIMGRSDTEKGAERAISIRRSQQKERDRLQKEIQTFQASISKINEERSPLVSQVRRLEAEVGPLTYVAELIYGSSDSSVVEKAVRMVIILLVIVFDPLATILLIAANHGIYGRKEKQEDISWIQKVKDLKLKRDPSKIEVDPNTIMKL